MLTFGPVPSRRLGRGLGINNIPPKFCTYSCRYCQVGPTPHTEVVPRIFYPPARIASVPIRPPAESDVKPPDAPLLNRFFQHMSVYVERLELLSGYEGDAFASSGDLAEDLLAIAAVHPLRASAVHTLIDRSGGDWSVVEQLVRDGLLIPTDFAGHRFYVRRTHLVETPAPRSETKAI